MSDDSSASTLALKDVLQDEELAHLFRNFLHQLHSSENLSFWLDVEEFKAIGDNYLDVRKQRATTIFDKYFSASSEAQVNVDAALREEVQLKIDTAGEVPLKAKLFDEMQEFVYGMMEFDSYRKFIASPEFKAWQAAGGTTKPKAANKSKFSFFKRRKDKEKKKAKKDAAAHWKTDSLILLENHIKNAKK